MAVSFSDAAIKRVVSERIERGESKQSIEDDFKRALKAELIDINTYYRAMVIIYK